MDYANALDSWWKAIQLLDVYMHVYTDIARILTFVLLFLGAFDFPLYTWRMLNVCIIFGLFSCSRFNCHLCTTSNVFVSMKFRKKCISIKYTYMLNIINAFEHLTRHSNLSLVDTIAIPFNLLCVATPFNNNNNNNNSTESQDWLYNWYGQENERKFLVFSIWRQFKSITF